MGTRYEVTMWDEIPEDLFLDLEKEIVARATEFDQKYSRFIKTSLVWNMAGKTGRFVVDHDFMEMLKLYRKLYRPTHKKFNPLIGFSISDMGYDEHYRLTPKEKIRPTPDLEKTVTILSESEIEIHDPTLFDVGGVGKGYFVDAVANFLKQKKIRRFLVNGSGDMYYQGDGQPITIGLEHPTNATKVIGAIQLAEGAFASSGISKRNWGKYHHIIDPISLHSPTQLLSSWVKADTCAMADALATCLFLVQAEDLTQHFPFEYLLLNPQYQIKKSAGFAAELF